MLTQSLNEPEEKDEIPTKRYVPKVFRQSREQRLAMVAAVSSIAENKGKTVDPELLEKAEKLGLSKEFLFGVYQNQLPAKKSSLRASDNPSHHVETE